MEIRILKDFYFSEKLKGLVILNENGYVVGLLVFGKKDEVFLLFFL